MSAAAQPSQSFYDAAGAQAAGHSDDAILAELAKAHNYNADAAMQAGWTKPELIQFLSQNRPPAQAAQPAQPQPQSLPGPGAGSPSASGFGTPSLIAPPSRIPGDVDIDQGMFVASEGRRRAKETFDTQQKNAQAITLAEAQRRAQGGMQEDVERTKVKLKQEDIDRSINLMKQDGTWDKLSAAQQGEVRRGNPLSIFKPQTMNRNAPGNSILATDPNAKDVLGGAVNPDLTYVTRDLGNGEHEYIPNAPSTRSVLMPGQTPGTVDRVNMDIHTNKPVGEVQRNVLPPAGYLPKTMTINGIQMVQQPDGTIAPVPTTSFTTSTPVLPGASTSTAAPTSAPGRNLPPLPGTTTPTPASTSPVTAPAPRPAAAVQPLRPVPTPLPTTARAGQPGPAVGGKSFSPEEQQTMRTQSSQIAKTIGTIGSVQDHLDILNSLIDAKKLDFVLAPGGLIHATVARNINLTPDEAKLAGDFRTLAEAINELRGPLGATGFRGAQAFEALQSQRGNLTGNPTVTKEILANTMDAFLLQRDALDEGLSRGLPRAPGHRLRAVTPDGQRGTVEREKVSEYFRKGYHLVP